MSEEQTRQKLYSRAKRSSAPPNAASGVTEQGLREGLQLSRAFVGGGQRVRSLALPILRSLRPHQWAKNALVVVPALGAQMHFSDAWRPLTFAILTFCLMASAVYLFNDMRDVQHDRLHPSKKKRPLASGEISMRTAAISAIALAAMSLAIANWSLGFAFAAVLIIYFLSSVAYSVFFKRFALVDIFVLAGLYGLRLLAGGVAVGLLLSPWLIAFNLFALLSLALIKRFVETSTAGSTGQNSLNGRGYVPSDSVALSGFGVASGFMAGVILALYIEDPRTQLLWSNPNALWAIVPLWLYWICHAWLQAHRLTISDDPVVFAITDRSSYTVGIALLVAVLIAS